MFSVTSQDKVSRETIYRNSCDTTINLLDFNLLKNNDLKWPGTL